MATDKRPVIKDIGDLRIIEATTVTEGVTTQTSFRWYHVAEDGEAYTGTSDKHWEDMSLDEFAASLEPIPDHHIYPELPADPAVTVAPDNLDESTAFIKRTGVTRYDPAHMLAPGNEGKDHLLEEVLRLETLSERPHPYLVRYLGCRVRHGRIRNIVLERLEWTLLDYAHEAPDKFAQIDKEAFLAGVESAVKYMHSLGLAHNDISPNNIMVREAEDGTCSPVVIDFGSCGPFGSRLMTAGSTDFVDTEDPEPFQSQKSHDSFALGRLCEWWDEALETEPDSAED